MPISVTAAILGGFSSVSVLCIFGFLKKFGIFYRIFHKVDKETKRNGGDLVGDVLMAHGVKQIFTLCGGHISPILVACEKLGIRVVDTRHEATAVFAADASARLSGVVGVAAVTAGPGVTNTVTAMKNAQMAESPVLLIGGAAATLLKNRGSLQDIDQLSLFRPVCKMCVSVTHLRDIVPTVRRAIQVAQSGTPGPVFVEFPINVLYPYDIVRGEIGVKDGEAKSIMQRITNWYLLNHLDDLFAGAFESRDLSPLPVPQTLPTSVQVKRCAELIRKAKQPLILIGSQATLPPKPINEIREAVERLGIPCFLGGMARGLLGRKSAIQMRQKRREALKEADVVVLAGTVCDFRLGYGRSFGRCSKIIAVNRDKAQLYKNSDMFWTPTVAVQADAGSFLCALSDELRGYECGTQWKLQLRDRDDKKDLQNLAASEEVTTQHLNPLKVLHHIEEVMSPNSIIVADGGDFVGSAAYILRPRGPLKWLDPGAFGTLGVGGGFALGAKVTCPDSEVWVIYGDGSLGYSVAEFDTFTRHKLPVIAVVGNDAGWTQIEREQVPMFNSSVACTLAFCDYDKVAIGYGGKGFRLGRDNEEQITDVLKRAQEAAVEGSSILINVLIGKTDFRKGSISV